LRVSARSSVIPAVKDPAEEFGPTIDDLVEAARAASQLGASRRTIRYWVSRRLVSAPARTGRSWRYPLRTFGEVEAVTRWRGRNATLDEIRFAVYIETGGGSPEGAIAYARQFLEAWEQSISAAAADAQANPEVIEEEAAKAARMRSRAPLPHRVRGVSLDERELAIAVVMSEMLGTPQDPETSEAGVFQLERIVGLRSGRGGADRDLGDVGFAPRQLAQDPAELRAALDRATPERIEFARRGVDFAVVWMPALRATLASEFGPAGAPMIDIIADWAEKLTVHVYALMFAIFIRNALERATDDQIAETLPFFYGPVIVAAILGERPAAERDLTLRRLRPYQRMLLERAPVTQDEDAA
jgi:DNA-binding transcriptional MerR regulator